MDSNFGSVKNISFSVYHVAKTFFNTVINHNTTETETKHSNFPSVSNPVTKHLSHTEFLIAFVLYIGRKLMYKYWNFRSEASHFG